MVDNPCIAWIGDHVNFFCEFCHTGFFPRLFQWNHHCCATRSVATGLVGLAPSGKVFDSLGGLQKWFVYLRIWPTKFGSAPNSSAA